MYFKSDLSSRSVASSDAGQMRTMLRVLTVSVLAGAFVASVAFMFLKDGSPLERICYAGALAAGSILQLSQHPPERCSTTSGRTWLILGFQTAATIVPLVLLPPLWTALPGVLIGSILLTVPGRRGWVIACCALAMTDTLQFRSGRDLDDVPFSTIAVFLIGVVLYGLVRLEEMVTALRLSRSELARALVSGERLRYARDTHDLIGCNLSVMALQAETIRRMLRGNPPEVDQRLEEITRTASLTHKQMRALSQGYIAVNFDSELDYAKTTLPALGINVSIRVVFSSRDLPERYDTVLSIVLREGVANILQHSSAQYCRISGQLDEGGVALIVENDGLRSGKSIQGRSSERGHAGLENLGLRLSECGGTLTTEFRSSRAFVLAARIPQADGPHAVDTAAGLLRSAE